MTIRELRLLPPLVIGRLGSSDDPVDGYSLSDDPDDPLGFRQITARDTLRINDDGTASIGEPRPITFKDAQGRVRPVAPFLEVFAIVNGESEMVPLTAEHAGSLRIEWRVCVANRKVERRTGAPGDRVVAHVDWFSDFAPKRLAGRSDHFVDGATIDLGEVRYIQPTKAYPGIRLRFTPAKGLIYGPHRPPEAVRKPDSSEADEGSFDVPAERAVYDTTKEGARWYGFRPYRGIVQEAAAYEGPDKFKEKVAEELKRQRRGLRASARLSAKVAEEVSRLMDGRFTPEEIANRDALHARETLPPSLYANQKLAPPWLNDDEALSRGYLDDTCDGIVEVRVTLEDGRELRAGARLCSAPPAAVPDTRFVRTMADDLEQLIYGHQVPDFEPPQSTRERALDTMRRAFETVRFLNVAVANGNPVNGRDPLDFDTMPAEEAFQTKRMMRPVFPEHMADTLAVMGLHQQVYGALLAGQAPWFAAMLRQPQRVTDYTDHGRRKMPALMCGADGSYLALTRRQIDTIQKAADAVVADSVTPRNLTAREQVQQQRERDLRHVALGNPASSLPAAAVANCTPGLEMDFRAVWRRIFEGIVLREYDNLVVDMEDGFTLPHIESLRGHRLLAIKLPDTRPGGNDEDLTFPMMAQMIGPSPADLLKRSALLATDDNPEAVVPLEWSNALARMVHEYAGTGRPVKCLFTRTPVWGARPAVSSCERIEVPLNVRPFFEGDTAMISAALAAPGELTQGLCSPWQNDYRECSCYYWASARPDFVNVHPSASGTSAGDNWLQKERTGEYVPDDYVDERLITYEDLLEAWEKWIRFQIGGRDVEDQG
jgi:hypothetical protein